MDDTLVISKNAIQILREEIGKYFELTEELIRPPKIYLCGYVQKVKLDNVMTAWSFNFSQYVRTSVKYMEVYLMTNMS